MTTILRGRILNFKSEPQGVEDTGSFDFFEDGAVAIADGMITSLGVFNEVSKDFPEAQIIDHRPHLIMPGFIDPHIHFPQMHSVGSYGRQLLEWLETYTFPQESRFSDHTHATRMANWFVDNLISQGTTTVAAYCTVHKNSAEALFKAATERNYRLIAGKVMMDRNAPDALLDTPKTGYDDSKALIADWHGKGRIDYAITPRFAITSTPEQLNAVQALVGEHPECYIQTHLNETLHEIEFTMSLYPDDQDYLAIYERHDMLTSKAIYGHCIHMTERERRAMAEAGSVATYCPSSNLFLGSGLYDDAQMRADGVRSAIATDVGGSTSYSMLQTMDQAYKVLQIQNQNLNPYRAFYWATLGNARSLDKADQIGSLDVGTEADLVVLNARATPTMEMRMETVEHLYEELFVIQCFGDDRAVVQTYVAGSGLKDMR